LTVLMKAYELDAFCAERAFQRMQDNGIVGDKLYMLWNDCCGRDTRKALDIMTTHSVEDIIHHINYDEGRGIPYETGRKRSAVSHLLCEDCLKSYPVDDTFDGPWR